MRSFEELTGTSQVSTWKDADIYADLVLEGVVCYGQLSGVVTFMEYDFSAGGGDTVQVKYVSPRTHSCASTGDDDACLCLSDTSTTFGTYNVKVQAWGDYDLVCDWSIFTAIGKKGVRLILNEMSKRMAKCRDEEIWNQLATDPGVGGVNISVKSDASCSSAVLDTSCCTYTFDLYNSVVSVRQHLKADAYDPDYVILHPEVASYFYYKEGNTAPFMAFMPGVKFDENGKLLMVAGLKVIECCNANACSASTSGVAAGVQAVVIDSKRAVAEAWGKRPTFYEFYDAKCNRWEEVCWMYWGAGFCDTNAIGYVTNP